MAKQIPLTRGYVAIVDDDDFDEVSQYKWHAVTKGGFPYAVRGVGKRPNRGKVSLHRVLLNAPDGMEVDHRNGDTLDCRRENLRLATHRQNAANRTLTPQSRSGFKGVYWYARDSRWAAQIRVAGTKMFLGYFEFAEDAARIYDDAAREHFGEFATLNFPQDGERAA